MITIYLYSHNIKLGHEIQYYYRIFRPNGQSYQFKNIRYIMITVKRDENGKTTTRVGYVVCYAKSDGPVAEIQHKRFSGDHGN